VSPADGVIGFIAERFRGGPDYVPRTADSWRSDRLALLWDYLSSWIGADGGVNGAVVHRGDLKRMFAIHDTPWTQHAVIEGLLHLHRRSGRDHWLTCALRLGDAQIARQEADGRFRWAGHEDDRFSSLVHNALADCALLDLAAVLGDRSDTARRQRYVTVAEKNLREYVIGKLYRSELAGFAMNPTDYYAGRDRFIVNMNSVAIEALIARSAVRRGSARHARPDGPDRSGHCNRATEACLTRISRRTHVPLYTALTSRGLCAMAEVSGIGLGRGRALGRRVLGRLEIPRRVSVSQARGWTGPSLPIFVAGPG
jgi:hypothetical protein